MENKPLCILSLRYIRPTKITLVFSDKAKANILNDYFCSMSTTVTDDSGTSLPIFNERTNSSLSNTIINITDVTDALRPLKVVIGGKYINLNKITKI